MTITILRLSLTYASYPTQQDAWTGATNASFKTEVLKARILTSFRVEHLGRETNLNMECLCNRAEHQAQTSTIIHSTSAISGMTAAKARRRCRIILDELNVSVYHKLCTHKSPLRELLHGFHSWGCPLKLKVEYAG